MNYLAKRNFDEVSLENVDESRKGQIVSIKNSIAFNYENTLGYAGAARKNLTQFSNDLLRTIKVKDTPEVEGFINELMTGLDKVDATTLIANKPGFFARLFHVDEIKRFITQYDDVEGIIEKSKEKLEAASFQIKKDIELCDRYMEQNLDYINELDNYILAGKIRIQEEQAAIDAETAAVDKTDLLAVHALKIRQDELDRFERKVHNLLLVREIAVQNIPQILLIKDGDSVLVEKIETSIESVIPLWESQMVIAIQLLRQKGALALEKCVTDTTNRLIETNGEMLKTSSIEIAKELERGVVDVEVLKKNSDNLISTLQEIKKIRVEGKEKRLAAAKELGVLQTKLNQQFLLDSAE